MIWFLARLALIACKGTKKKVKRKTNAEKLESRTQSFSFDAISGCIDKNVEKPYKLQNVVRSKML